MEAFAFATFRAMASPDKASLSRIEAQLALLGRAFIALEERVASRSQVSRLEDQVGLLLLQSTTGSPMYLPAMERHEASCETAVKSSAAESESLALVAAPMPAAAPATPAAASACEPCGAPAGVLPIAESSLTEEENRVRIACLDVRLQRPECTPTRVAMRPSADPTSLLSKIDEKEDEEAKKEVS